MGHIFISYSHKDKDYVHKLQEALKSEGFDVWIDDRIDYGDEWPIVIQERLDACDAFILVATENSFKSKWVQKEVTRAQRINKPFFPLLLSGDTWLSIESTQYVDVKNQELPPKKFYERLAHVAPRRNVNILSTDENGKLAEAFLQDYWNQLGDVLDIYYKNGAPSSELEEIEKYILKIEKVLGIPGPHIPGPHMVGGGSIRKIKHGSASYSVEDAPPAPSSKSEEEKYRSLLAKLEGNYKVAEGMIANEARHYPTLTREELIVVIVKRLERYKK